MSRALVLDDAADAAAAGRCLVARSGEPTRQHPRRCGWCDYPAEVLKAAVDGYVVWADPDERLRIYGRHDARIFAELPKERQAELVLAAQGFDDAEAGPSDSMPAVVAAPADEPPSPQEERTVPDWFES